MPEPRVWRDAEQVSLQDWMDAGITPSLLGEQGTKRWLLNIKMLNTLIVSGPKFTLASPIAEVLAETPRVGLFFRGLDAGGSDGGPAGPDPALGLVDLGDPEEDAGPEPPPGSGGPGEG